MTSAALPVQVALVSESAINPGQLLPVAAALQEQVNRDFAPLWHVNATVTPFLKAKQVPAGHWPIIIRDRLDEPGALGYHTDTHRQPIAYVEATPDWTVTASHELLEMLADPFGARLWTAHAPDGQGRVRYLIETCDPCEAVTYEIGGVLVSDFATPAWYHTVRRLGHQYSLTGSLTASRQILSGGYVSFIDDRGTWHQQTWFSGDQPRLRTLGRLEDFAEPGESLREAIDRVTRAARTG